MKDIYLLKRDWKLFMFEDSCNNITTEYKKISLLENIPNQHIKFRKLN